MESVAAIGARIDAIEARLASLSGSAASASTVPGRTAATAAAALLPAGVGGTSGGLAGTTAGAGTFAAALAAARGGAPGTGAGGAGPSSFATLLAGLRPAALGGPGALAGTTSPASAPAVAAAAPAAPAAALSAAALEGYGNGRIPPAALASIGGGERLWAPAAAAFTRMRDAASAAGVHLGVNDSYRSFDEQVDVARRKGLYSAGGLAAQPGTSDHGWGRAVDLQLDARAQAWMRANGERFGFAEDTPREPWHWAYEG